MADFCYAEGCTAEAAPGWQARIDGTNQAVLLCEAHLARVRAGEQPTLIPPEPGSIQFTDIPGQMIIHRPGWKVRFEGMLNSG